MAKVSKPSITTISIEVGKVIHAILCLHTISTRFDPNTPAFDSYRVSRLLAGLCALPEVSAADKVRGSLLEKYGGKSKQVPLEKMADFEKEYEPIGAEMIKVKIVLLPVSVFEHAVGIQPAEMAPILPFLVEE